MIQPTLIDTAPQNRREVKRVLAKHYGHVTEKDPTILRLILDALDVDYAKCAHTEYGIEVHENGTTGPRIVILKTTDKTQAEENLRDLQREPDLWLDPKLVRSTVVRSTWDDA